MGFIPTPATSLTLVFNPIAANAIDKKNFDRKEIFLTILSGTDTMLLKVTIARKPRINHGKILITLTFSVVCADFSFFAYTHEKIRTIGTINSILVSLTMVAREPAASEKAYPAATTEDVSLTAVPTQSPHPVSLRFKRCRYRSKFSRHYKDVFIYFEKENINTGSMESELMLSILSGLAESESVSISENNKWSIKRRFENGTYKISYPPYGYDNVDGEMVINKSQAKIVRFIFAEILSGKGTHKIANELNRRKVPTKKGGRWTSTTIRGMVSNEKYTGDVIFQKTFTDEHFNRHNNNGEKDQYLIRNHHEPIISHENFEAAQDIIDQRGKEKGLEKQNTKYQNRYPFSGKIICDQCGGTFKRRSHSSGRHRIAWCCSNHIVNIKKCSMKYVPETDFEYAFVTMMNKLIFGHVVVLKPLLVSLRGMSSDETLENIRALDKKLEENTEQRNVLVGLMTKGYLEPAVYNKSNNELLQEAERLRRQKESITRFLNNDFQNLSEVSALLQYAAKTSMLKGFDGVHFQTLCRAGSCLFTNGNWIRIKMRHYA